MGDRPGLGSRPPLPARPAAPEVTQDSEHDEDDHDDEDDGFDTHELYRLLLEAREDRMPPSSSFARGRRQGGETLLIVKRVPRSGSASNRP